MRRNMDLVRSLMLRLEELPMEMGDAVMIQPGCRRRRPRNHTIRYSLSGLGGHPGERRNGVHVARRTCFGGGNDKLR